MTLGVATAAQIRLIVWCKACQHQVEPEPAEQVTSVRFTEMAARYGAETPGPRLARAVQPGPITRARPPEGCATCGKLALRRS
jgi:hypothetical protein